MSIVLAILFIIIVQSVGEDAILNFIGGILGLGYGIILIIGFCAVVYGIYSWFSDLFNGR